MVRVAVIGAGASGLTACKSCIEEDIDVVCFEKTGRFAGLWNYHEEDSDGVASTMKSTVINTSKEMSAFSDFPPPAEYPNYMNHSLVLKYLTSYAEAYDVLRVIKYHHQVIQVFPSSDYVQTGQWVVRTINHLKNDLVEEVFDGVMICTGHHVYPNIPEFPGQKKFAGSIKHTHSLRVVDEFKDKRVVVIGIGNSGVDAAVEISNVAKQVYLSTRRGTWVFPRQGFYGWPFDAQIEVRAFNTFGNIVGPAIKGTIVEFMLNLKFDHAAYNLKPAHRFDEAHPTINDILPSKISSGAVIIKGNVEKFTNNGVIFQDEQHVTKADSVILATGYEMKFSFLDSKIIRTTEKGVDLYKFMFPPDLEHPTLCAIGLLQPLGPLFPVMEAQSRWFAAIMSKKASLPDRKEMWLDINRHREETSKKFVSSSRHSIEEADYIFLMDDIYSRIGVKPNFLRMILTDPTLFFYCFLGPAVPYVYRLQGLHVWPGARKAILGTRRRIVHPYKTRNSSSRNTLQSRILLVFCLPFILGYFFLCYF